jgi:hypothetical protein
MATPTMSSLAVTSDSTSEVLHIPDRFAAVQRERAIRAIFCRELLQQDEAVK